MKVFTVTQINRIIKDLIDNEILLEDIVVKGELSSFSVTRGIAYFSIKDNDNMLACVQFNNKAEFKIGDMVECRGNVKYYAKTGKLTFNVLSIELCGQGELYKQFLELKAKLEAEGLFDEKHKIAIPKFVNSIGVVTSKTGAVLQDIKNVSSRRNPNLDIYVYDAQVQGKYAVDDIIKGIMYFDNMSDVDVIIVARGGGSIEDLQPFNDEELARIAFICNKPLISAVGHETDFSILDFVADLRAPTPSAAAEIVSIDTENIKRYIKDLTNTFNLNISNLIENMNSDLNMSIMNIENMITNKVNEETLRISEVLSSIENTVSKNIDNTIYKVNICVNTLDMLNPIKLLKSGYSIVTKNNDVVNSDNVVVGDKVDIITNDIKIMATVDTVIKK